MSQILKKFIGNNEVGAAKIRLENNSYLRARNAANSADIDAMKVNGSNAIEFASTPVVGGSNLATETFVNTAVTNATNNIKFKGVRAATTANITIATALNNGDTLDGVTLATNDLVLVKNQTAPEENGVYVVGVTPARASFADTFDKHVGLVCLVSEGTVNADLAFVFTSDAGGTLDTTALVVEAFPTNSVLVPVWEKETFTLAGGDITNQYVDLANVAETDSIDLFVRGGGIMEEGQSFTVSYTGGAGGNTRISFAGILATGGASELIAGDVLVVKYQY